MSEAAGSDGDDRQLQRSLLRRVVYDVCRRAALALFIVFYKTRVVNKEAMPQSGALLVVANHQSFFDPPLAGGWTPRQLAFLARAGLFKFPPLGWLISTLNSVPVSGDGSDAAAIRTILAELKRGRAVMIFPEGSRTFDGALGEFQRGVALLVKKAKCPVLPVAIEGAFDAWPRTKKLPSLFGKRLAVQFGE
ncbi:MAG: lysophospholipid acyltransferase family protein, partial [Planctomycetota bacterium]